MRSAFASPLLSIPLLLSLAGCACGAPSAVEDAGRDAALADSPMAADVAPPGDAPAGDAPATDAPAADDAPASADAPAMADAPVACAPAGYPVSVAASRAERDTVDAAARAFGTATGASVVLDDTTAAVTGITGGTIPLALDAGIADPCDRAHAALQAFFAAHADLFRLPPGLTVRVCSYDALTDAEIVRLHGGTYGGRPLVGLGNDLLAHVGRSGTLRYFAGGYLPDVNRGLPEPCLGSDGLASAVVGVDLEYTRFSLCVPGGAGAIAIDPSDTRTPGEPALYVDAAGFLHLARYVEVLLAPARVTSSEIQSDLFCCPGASLADCVGKTLVVDEVDGAVLEQIPRCHTC